MHTPFVHLQCHTEFSLSDGILRIEAMVGQAAKYGMPAIALTDRSNLFGMVKFYRAALAANIKPILGCDLWLENPDQPEQPHAILVYCQNFQGYKNLAKIISDCYLHGQEQGKPIVKIGWLQQHHQDLLMVMYANLTQPTVQHWQNIFAQRLYLGLTRVGRVGEEEDLANTLQLAQQQQLPVVALNAACFLHAEDYEAHEARICIHDGVTLDDPRRVRKHTQQQYLRNTEEMAQLFADIPSAIINTEVIARRCNLILELGKAHLPNFPVPAHETPEQYLFNKAHAGLLERLLNPAPHYVERLNTELKVINDMGFASYFLIVADFIAWSFANQIPVGPGRGSGAGSLVAYVLRITDLDPLQYDLLFERFLNPERVSMPDFDIDFCMEGRDRVIDYVAQKYGRDSVSQIITYGTMAARAVIRDVGRVLGHPYGFVDKIAKLIPMELGITLDKALAQEEALSSLYNSAEEVKTLIDLAKKLEGVTRNVGKHAGGVVIAPAPLTEFTPLYCEPGEQQTITQLDKDDVESIGLVKFDFLGLRTLTIIDWTVRTIRERCLKAEDAHLDISKIPLDDNATFKLLCAVNTTAIFQLESRGMKDLIRRLHPDSFEDIIALVALFRPGPLQSGMVDDFINRKLGKATIVYPHADLEPILKPTYGVILYQEQVMQIAQVLAGYTLGAADLLRRAMGKKKPEEMAEQREIFTNGAVARGVPAQTATFIFDLMEKFAGYGFNKSHSAAYALVSYQTAWLKAHYPSEFMAAVLSADMAHTDKVVAFIDDCHTHGIKTVAPCINHSIYKFSVDTKNRIVYGLGAIKGVGEAAIDNILLTRNANGKFKDLFDLVRRIDGRKVTRRVLEALINSGALDTFGLDRSSLMGNLDRVLQAVDQLNKDADHGQIDLFTDAEVDHNFAMLEYPPWSDEMRLSGEKSSLGLYLSGHPLQQYAAELDNIITHKIIELHPTRRGEHQIIAGLIIATRTMITKRGDKMAFITLEDRSGRQEIAVFADLWTEVRDLLKKDNIVIVKGETKHDDYTGGVRMRALQIMDLDAARQQFAKKIRLQIEADGLEDDFVTKLQATLHPYMPGSCSIELFYSISGTLAQLQFGSSWLVQPQTKLLNDLRDLHPGKVQTEVCY